MPNIGPMELMLVLVVALLVLGPARLPEAGRQVGKALAEFRRISSGVQRELREALEEDGTPDPPAPRDTFDDIPPPGPTPVDLDVPPPSSQS